MARKTETVTTTTITDDLDGRELSEDEVVSIEFAFARNYYRLDVSADNAESINDQLAELAKSATKVARIPAALAKGESIAGVASSHGRRRKPTRASKKITEYHRKIKDWADDNDVEYNSSGPLRQDVVAAYEAAEGRDEGIDEALAELKE